MKFRVATMMEMVFVCGCGFATARILYEKCDASNDGPSYWFELVLRGIIPGVVLAELAAQTVECCGNLSPSIWGFGRRAWGITGIYVLVYGISEVLPSWFRSKFTSSQSSNDWFVIDVVAEWQRDEQSGTLPWIILTLFIASFMAKLPKDPKPDFREWTGRIFAVLLVGLWIAHRIIFPWS